jgi:hypothetical protein
MNQQQLRLKTQTRVAISSWKAACDRLADSLAGFRLSETNAQ